MLVTISLNEILIFIFLIAGITLLVYLVITVNNINNGIKDLKYVLNKNKNNIDNTISLLPGIAYNIKSITEDVKEGVQTIALTAETVEKNIDKIVGKTETSLDYVEALSEVIKYGINYLSKRR